MSQRPTGPPGGVPTNRLEDQEELLTTMLEMLLYEDTTIKPLTYRTLNYFERIKSSLGEANAFFIRALLEFNDHCRKDSLFNDAKSRGCKHPLLYYFMDDISQLDGEWQLLAGRLSKKTKALMSHVESGHGTFLHGTLLLLLRIIPTICYKTTCMLFLGTRKRLRSDLFLPSYLHTPIYISFLPLCQ